MSKAKILIFDIETSPNLADVWGLWNNNVSLNQLRESGHIMSFAAKWYKEDDIIYEETRTDNDRALVRKIIKLFDQADIIVAHNGKNFDIPWVQGRAAVYGMRPPSPFKVVDTLQIARNKFKHPSNKLEYLLKAYKCSQKKAHKKFPGHELWTECLNGNPEAWEEMREYNIQDVVGLEELYTKFIPWTTGHPNMGIYTDGTKPVCDKCGSSHLQKRGTYRTNLSVFQRYSCMDCGSWPRGRTNLLTKDQRAELLTDAK